MIRIRISESGLRSGFKGSGSVAYDSKNDLPVLVNKSRVDLWPELHVHVLLLHKPVGQARVLEHVPKGGVIIHCSLLFFRDIHITKVGTGLRGKKWG